MSNPRQSFEIPDVYVRDVFAIDYQKLRSDGIDTLLSDLDGTLKGYHDRRPSKEIVGYFAKRKTEGFKCAIVTNTVWIFRRWQAEAFARVVGVPCVCLGLVKKKHNPWGIQRALDILKSSARKAMVIGDDATRDVAAGKKAGVALTVLVPTVGQLPRWYNILFWIQQRRDRLIKQRFHRKDP